MATGEEPYVAINHWDAAIAMHKANNPTCKHYIEDVYKVSPTDAMGGYHCELLWASPTCTHFSRAKGKRLAPSTVKIRGLAWSIIPWIKQVRPDVIIVENVLEFEGWGPICHQHDAACTGELDESGDSCAKRCPYGRPIKSRMGETFRAWKRRILSFGYSFEVRKLIAWEYGAPTTRPRLYIVMRSDGQPATWPAPTHTRENWRTAASIIDWSIPCPSVFDRKKPHVAATRRRLAKGVRKFVLETAKPFLVQIADGVGVPYMIHRSNGERLGQEPRVYDVQSPHPVVVASGKKTSPVIAFMAKGFSERHASEVQASELTKPIGVTTAKDHHSLVAASLVRYNGQSIGQSLDTPIGVIDTHDRYAMVYASAAEWTDEIAAKARRVYRLLLDEKQDGPWMDHENEFVRVPGFGLVIYDLGMRMLVVRELFRANGFPDDYVIDLIGPRGKPLTKTEQTKMAGNVVCPDVASALIRAALSGPGKPREVTQFSFLEAA